MNPFELAGNLHTAFFTVGLDVLVPNPPVITEIFHVYE